MTQPVQEPLTQRSISTLQWGQNQLQRRPDVGVASPEFATQWIQLFSDTNTGTSLTNLDWVALDGEWDVTGSFETFNVNAGGNLEIGHDGTYQMSIAARGNSNAANVLTARFINVDNIAGETAKGMFTPWTTAREASWISRIYDVSNADSRSINPWPAFMDWAIYGEGTFGVGTAGASEFQVQAVKEEDGSGVAESTWEFWMLVLRLGGPVLDA